MADRPRLDDLLAAGRLKRHRPTPGETGDLLALAARQLSDASAIGLPVLLGDTWRRGATYLDACRRKRNIAQYDHADTVTAAESQALCAAARELQDAVITWLAEAHPELLGST